MIRVYATRFGFLLERGGRFFRTDSGFAIDALFRADDPAAYAELALERGAETSAPAEGTLAAPIGSQEVWAAGVTYLRSKSARMAEAKDAGAGSFYDRVYEADRPELFFKSTAHRVAAPGGVVRIRSDSRWNVPEPELTLAIDTRGRIFGFTLGNDMSSRDIEGENPLYLPQAKIYHLSAAIGPCLVIAPQLPPATTTIHIEILRGGSPVFAGETTIGRIKRPLPSLAEWLYRDNSFPNGSYLMTGTGIVPADSFTLAAGDEIRISAEPIGTLVNTVEA
jgi:2-dehydro-3-deoxy-D-arabinonate dehydratase